MSDHESKEEVKEDINVKKENVTRREDPSLVGSTFIKYAAYILNSWFFYSLHIP